MGFLYLHYLYHLHTKLDTDQRVPLFSILGFDEKSSSSKPSLVNAGIYFFNTKILSEIPPKEKVSLEYDFFPSFVGKDMFGYVTGERLFDIGTPERLSIARKNLV